MEINANDKLAMGESGTQAPQNVCCLTHILRSVGSSPCSGSLLFALILLLLYFVEQLKKKQLLTQK